MSVVAWCLLVSVWCVVLVVVCVGCCRSVCVACCLVSNAVAEGCVDAFKSALQRLHLYAVSDNTQVLSRRVTRCAAVWRPSSS